MAAHTLTVGPVAEQGFAFEVARRNAINGTSFTVDQMLTVELIAIGQAFAARWQATTLALAQQKINNQVPATQATTLTSLSVPTDPTLLAQAAVPAGVA